MHSESWDFATSQEKVTAFNNLKDLHRNCPSNHGICLCHLEWWPNGKAEKAAALILPESRYKSTSIANKVRLLYINPLTADRSFSNDIHRRLHFARKPPQTGPSDTQIAQKPLPGSPSAWKAKERPRSPYKKFEFSTLEGSRSSSRASLHVIVTFMMDPLAVLAGMDAMDAAGVPVEEIPDSDGEFDDRSLEGSEVDVLSSDEEELWMTNFSVMVRRAARQVTRRSQGQRTPTRTPTSRMTAEQCADVDVEQEADVDEDEDLAVATLLDEEEETYEGVDGEVAVVERADEDEDGEERMPTTAQRLATTTRMTVD